MKERKDYEIRAEIIVKQLKSKIYDLEAKAMEARMNADSGFDELEMEIKNLTEQRKKLDRKLNDLKNSSQEKWDTVVVEFEDFLQEVNADKQTFAEKAESWINDFTEKINELEEKAKHANDDMKEKLNEQIENIKKYKSNLDEMFSQVRDSQEKNLNIMKNDFEEGVAKVKESISKALEYVKK